MQIPVEPAEDGKEGGGGGGGEGREKGGMRRSATTTRQRRASEGRGEERVGSTINKHLPLPRLRLCITYACMASALACMAFTLID